MTAYSSDAAALEAAGKKEVLKVNKLFDCVIAQLANVMSIARMEFLGSFGHVRMHSLHLGSNECAICRGIFEWRTCLGRVWVHCVRFGHTGNHHVDG